MEEQIKLSLDKSIYLSLMDKLKQDYCDKSQKLIKGYESNEEDDEIVYTETECLNILNLISAIKASEI